MWSIWYFVGCLGLCLCRAYSESHPRTILGPSIIWWLEGILWGTHKEGKKMLIENIPTKRKLLDLFGFSLSSKASFFEFYPFKTYLYICVCASFPLLLRLNLNFLSLSVFGINFIKIRNKHPRTHAYGL